jgi:hypothetical protein
VKEEKLVPSVADDVTAGRVPWSPQKRADLVMLKGIPRGVRV